MTKPVKHISFRLSEPMRRDLVAILTKDARARVARLVKVHDAELQRLADDYVREALRWQFHRYWSDAESRPMFATESLDTYTIHSREVVRVPVIPVAVREPNTDHLRAELQAEVRRLNIELNTLVKPILDAIPRLSRAVSVCTTSKGVLDQCPELESVIDQIRLSTQVAKLKESQP